MSLNKLKKSLEAITALKRTTSAMRVLSMSLHSLSRKKVLFYQTLLQKFYQNLSLSASLPDKTTDCNNKNLIVIIGSQRGLCGKYNHKIKRYFLESLKKANTNNTHYLIIGKQLVNTMGTIVQEYNMTIIPTFSLQSIHACYTMITKHSVGFDNLIFYYTNATNLFTNTVITKTINLHNDDNTQKTLPKEYTTGHFSLEETFHEIHTFNNACTIKSILAKAIESEQSIRFLSMDKAFKNSTEIIMQKKLLYNKLRHEKINKQLLEIIGSTL